MSDDKRVLDEPVYIECPHWGNDYHTNWKQDKGLWLELTAPGELEYSLRLCPICANVVRKKVMTELIEPILTREAQKLLRRSVDKS